MNLIKISKSNRSAAITLAIETINDGGVVVARADTSYAILSRCDDNKARQALSKIKGARGGKQYSLFVSDKSYILDNVRECHRKLVEKLLPGCVSIVVDKNVPALRYINNITINTIVSGCGQLTATSANPSDLEPARDLAMLNKYFSNLNVLVLFEGTVPKQLPSTIVDVSDENVEILRQGAVKIDLRTKKS